MLTMPVFCCAVLDCTVSSAAQAQAHTHTSVHAHALEGGISHTRLKEPINLAPGLSHIDLRRQRDSYLLCTGSRLVVSILTPLDSSTARVGDRVSAMLLTPVAAGKNGSNLLAPGTILSGWVSDVFHVRRALSSQLSPSRWSNSNAALNIHFDRIQSHHGPGLAISANPAKETAVFGTGSEFEFAVNKRGEITLDFSRGKYTATSVAVGAVSLATGPLSLVVGPALSGTAGAMDPAYALDRPVSQNESHRRFRGFCQGMVKGLPGGSLLLGTKHRGLGVELPAGAQFCVELDNDLVIPNKPWSR